MHSGLGRRLESISVWVMQNMIGLGGFGVLGFGGFGVGGR